MDSTSYHNYIRTAKNILSSSKEGITEMGELGDHIDVQ
jgi:hypothetical protein